MRYTPKLLWLILLVLLPGYLMLNQKAWHIFSFAYLIIANLFIWFLVVLLYKAVSRGEKAYPELNERFTVIVPVYNETKQSFLGCIKSIAEADGDKDIIIVDDGSTNGIGEVIKYMPEIFPQVKHVHRFSSNNAKRHAQDYLISKAETDIIVTVDSDLVFKKDAFTKLIAPLQEPVVGITSGQVLIKNEFSSILSRIQGILWWCANNIGRRSLGNFGIMACASGTMLAFRKQHYDQFRAEYISQRFLGNLCTFGEDRFMTNLTLRAGLKVMYVEASLGFTDAKETYKAYVKQQLRWRRSMIRESFWALKHFAWKRNKALFTYLLFNLILPFWFLAVIIPFIIQSIAFGDLSGIAYFIGAVITIVFIRNLPMVFENRKRTAGIIPYALFGLLFIMPLWAVALFSLDKTGWGTR
jgi:cellulose synthase/poly-beta-1,6-N-acetylglucosamine synthase-like glycosyltransferase